MTDGERAEQFAQLLDQVPSLLTICLSEACTFAEHIHVRYPHMITLEWVRSIRDLTINDHGLSGTLTFGSDLEFVYVPWRAIINVRPPYGGGVSELETPPPTPRPSLRVIRGGKS